jgi:hypothetical protein
MIPVWAAIVGGIYLAGACTTFTVLFVFGSLANGLFGMPKEKHLKSMALVFAVLWFILLPLTALRKR